MERKTWDGLIAVRRLGIGAFAGMSSPVTEQRTRPPPRPIPTVKAADVAHLEVTDDKQQKTVLDKKDGRWRITAPSDWPADQAGVKALTDALEKVTFGDVVSEGKEKHDELGVAEGK